MSLRVFVEGGGDSADTKALLREGYAKLFAKIVPEGRQPRVVVCGGRDQALKDFCTALKTGEARDNFLLLVDSEGPIQVGAMVWVHFRQRDGWTCPAGADDSHIHLMVQCMESWFLAEPAMLAEFYHDHFEGGGLPGNPNIEEIPKQTVERTLKHATRNTQKEAYHKIRHGPKLLAALDPARLRPKSFYFTRLCEALELLA